MCKVLLANLHRTLLPYAWPSSGNWLWLVSTCDIFCRTHYMLRQPRKSSLKIIVNTGLRSLLLDYHNKSEKNIPSFALCESSRSTPSQWEEVLRDNLNTACKEARGGKGTPLSELRVLMTKRHYFINQSIKNAHISILGWICTGPSSSVY